MSDCVSFPLETAADQLGVNRRTLIEWLRAHPRDANGQPFYRCAGRTKLFTDSDVRRIDAHLVREWFHKSEELLAYISQRKNAKSDELSP